MYEQMPQKIRAAYGEEYLKKFFAITVESKPCVLCGLIIRVTHALVDYSARGGPTNAPIEPVVDDIKHAIMSENPRIRYKPAQLGWIFWWFFYNTLPEELTHLYITKWCLKNFPKPANASD